MDPLLLFRCELEGTKQALSFMFMGHCDELKKQFEAAVNQACSPEKITDLLNKAADKYIKEAIDIEVKHFFLDGDGRSKVKAAIEKKLTEELS